MIWRPALYEDLMRVDLQWIQADQDMREEFADTPRNQAILRESCRSWEAPDGRILSVVGVTPMWKGVGHVWALNSSEALERPIALSKGVYRWMAWIWRKDGLWRLQADVEHGHESGRRWLLFLGFHYEGTMRAYGPTGSDHDLYARLEAPWQRQPRSSG
jgi:hypothetical protein